MIFIIKSNSSGYHLAQSLANRLLIRQHTPLVISYIQKLKNEVFNFSGLSRSLLFDIEKYDSETLNTLFSLYNIYTKYNKYHYHINISDLMVDTKYEYFIVYDLLDNNMDFDFKDCYVISDNKEFDCDFYVDDLDNLEDVLVKVLDKSKLTHPKFDDFILKGIKGNFLLT